MKNEELWISLRSVIFNMISDLHTKFRINSFRPNHLRWFLALV